MESSLSANYEEIKSEVAFNLGFGRGAERGDPAWDSRQLATLDSCIKSGLRQFYWPPPMDGQSVSYEWSFLRPTMTLTLASGLSAIDLPADFASFTSSLSLLNADVFQCEIPIVSEGMVRQQFSAISDSNGSPIMAAVRPKKGVSISQGQRFDLFIYPASDGEYTIQGQYNILPDYLSGTKPYAYGGASHIETVIQSCLSMAEINVDDRPGGHKKQFKERLAASISMDSRNKPHLLGYNADRSDEFRSRDVNDLRRSIYNGSRITYVGS